jgi:hypothetical protein
MCLIGLTTMLGSILFTTACGVMLDASVMSLPYWVSSDDLKLGNLKADQLCLCLTLSIVQ